MRILSKPLFVCILAAFFSLASCTPLFPDQKGFNELTADLEKGSKSEKVEAARLLPQHGDIAVWPLQKALFDSDWEVRGAAAYGLGQVGPKAKVAAPDLMRLLNDEFSYVQTLAEQALRKINADNIYR